MVRFFFAFFRLTLFGFWEVNFFVFSGDEGSATAQFGQGRFAQEILIGEFGLFGSHVRCAGHFFNLFFLTQRTAFQCGLGHLAHEQFNGANGIIVGWDHVVHIARVAVGVHQGNDRDIEQVGFVDGGRLAVHIDHEHHLGQVHHAADAAHRHRAADQRAERGRPGLALGGERGDLAPRASGLQSSLHRRVERLEREGLHEEVERAALHALRSQDACRDALDHAIGRPHRPLDPGGAGVDKVQIGIVPDKLSGHGPNESVDFPLEFLPEVPPLPVAGVLFLCGHLEREKEKDANE